MVERLARSVLSDGDEVLYADADNLVLREEFNTMAQARSRVSLYGLAGLPVTMGDDLRTLPPERCGRLELAYREGGWYSGIKYYFPTPVPFEEIQIRVFSPDFHGIVVRLIDQSSQTHQLFLPFKSGEGWQTVTVRRPKWSYHFWAGANDGKWHGGIVGIQLLAEGIRLNDRKARRGFLYFNRISVITPQNGNDVK